MVVRHQVNYTFSSQFKAACEGWPYCAYARFTNNWVLDGKGYVERHP